MNNNRASPGSNGGNHATGEILLSLGACKGQRPWGNDSWMKLGLTPHDNRHLPRMQRTDHEDRQSWSAPHRLPDLQHLVVG
jgi:hypothetical protein